MALAGVDPHTIGCMLMIAEYTPASQDFRTKLSKFREQQRLDRVWLYKLVEIGACTNFLADQMLKTRAGENVIALMAAVATVMDEQNCTAVLLALFEAAKASLDNTPGITQLQNIRSSLVSLACKTGFAEKTLQYHYFFLSLLGRKEDGQASQRAKKSPYEGLPHAKDIPKLMQLMHKLIATDDQRCIVRYSGLRGAAWMATYASYILGLGTCAVRADSTPVPITSGYEEARVIFEVSASENTGGLYLERNLEDLISLETGPPSIFSGWRIDCSRTDFVNLHHRSLCESHPVALARISTFAAIEVINEISTLSSSFDLNTSGSFWYRHHSKSPRGFLSFTHAGLPMIQSRALRILMILGFRPPEEGYRFRPQGDVETYSCYGHESDPEPIFEGYSDEDSNDSESDGPSHEGSRSNTTGFFRQFKNFSRTGWEKPKGAKKTFQSRRGQYVEQGSLAMVKENTLERLKYYLDDHTNPELQKAASWSRPTLRDLVRSITVAVHVASRLAFTDWDTNLRIMSANTMSYREIPEVPASLSNFEGHIKEAIALCSDSLPIDSIEQRLWTADWVGLDIDGIVILRNAAIPDSWAVMRGAFLGFRRGRILHENQQYTKIRIDRINTLSQNFRLEQHEQSAIWASGTSQKGSPSMQSRVLVMPMADTVFLRVEVTPSPGVSVIGDGSLSARFAPDYLVTTPCADGYIGPSISPTGAPTDTYYGYNFVSSMALGLSFDDHALQGPQKGRKKGANIFYQLTNENKLAQWLALQWEPASSPYRCLRILQKDCCFQCLLDRLYIVLGELDDFEESQGYPICIIAGNGET
ncbi:hypothetical protein BJX99DRAFT_259421 [Aspergillus californicus]